MQILKARRLPAKKVLVDAQSYRRPAVAKAVALPPGEKLHTTSLGTLSHLSLDRFATCETVG